MRSSTKTFVGLASLGVLVASAKFGLPAAAVSNASSVSSETTSNTTTAPVTSENPSTSSTSTANKDSTSTATTADSSTSSSSTDTAATPTPTATATSKTSSAIDYRFGTVQVKVTKTGDNITDITYIQATATKGRSAVFPDLVTAAIDANGSGFGNFGGATFTTDAFKQALDNALGKF